MEIILGLLPVLIQVIGWFVERSKLSKEMKEAFFDWVKLAGKDLGSQKLMEYGDAQVAWLKANPWKETGGPEVVNPVQKD